MLVTITAPEETCDVMGHVTARRGRVDGKEAHGNSQSFSLCSSLLKWLRVLRSASSRTGTFMMVFDHYEDVPKSAKKLRKTKVKTNRVLTLRRKSLMASFCL